MTVRLRTAFILGFIALALVFFYFERAILTPFIAAGIFAYIFNPIVNFFSHKVKLPRILSVIIIYFVLISVFSIFTFFLIKGLLLESSEFEISVQTFVFNTKHQINLLPSYARPFIYEIFNSLGNVEIFKPASLFLFFPKAISGIISVLIFVFSSFYFLKEGREIVDKLLLFSPKEYRVEIEILLRRINGVLSAYLRGQIFMIFLVSLILYVALSLLGVKFALIIAIFSGIAEIVPIIGPITAAAIAAIAVLVGGGSTDLALNPAQTSISVVIVYFVLRQLQDYFIVPHVMGRITKLHPLIILLAVLAGGHSGGIMGLLLAVPIAAVLKILLDFFLKKSFDFIL